MNSPLCKHEAFLNALIRPTRATSAFTSNYPSRSQSALFVFAVLTALLSPAASKAQSPTHGAFGQTPDAVQNGNAVLVSHFDQPRSFALPLC